jgi:NAD(P)-dependent dehydrogenase (short-subunit alcohol dehydrogenase family)
MYEDLKGKTILITGAGKTTGIGYGITEKLAASGANVVIADLGVSSDELLVRAGTSAEMEEIAKDLAERYGVKTLAVNLDVCDPESIEAAFVKIKETFDGLDGLVNNAGATFGVPNMVSTYDEAAWMKTIDVNLHGVFRVSRAALPMMFGRDGAAIVNIASRAGKIAPVFNGAYAVAKAGVIMLSKVMAREVAPAGVRINSICPAQIGTDLEKWRFGLEAQVLGGTPEDREAAMCETIPMGRIGAPDEVGALAAFLLSSESSYITGQSLNVCGGQSMEL